jgi:dinuclear metal center YbgI/SA1388 family protein
MISCIELDTYLSQLLMKDPVIDYCPNGLQVQGKSRIKKIVLGVSANQALIDEAIAQGADALLVHHGFFFKGDDPCVKGVHAKRLSALMSHHINLFAYHLPLDLHVNLGNNAQLAKQLGCVDVSHFNLLGIDGLGWKGSFSQPMKISQLTDLLSVKLNRPPEHFGIKSADDEVNTLAWCTGAAQDGIHDAYRVGADVYLSGEISERTVALAKEYPIDYMCCGHHATERGGVIALGDHLVEMFDVECIFIDIDNPI